MNQIYRNRRQSTKSCSCLRSVIRIFGIMTAFVICGVGVDVYLHGYRAGEFIIIGSAIILLLEIKWIITLFLQLLLPNNIHAGWMRCWNSFRVAGGWRLSLPYIAIGTSLILWPHNLWLSYVAGLLLIVQAVLRLCTLIRFSRKLKDEGLLPHCDFQKIDGYAKLPEDSCAEVELNLENEEPIDDVC